jgi:hypothetical protein
MYQRLECGQRCGYQGGAYFAIFLASVFKLLDVQKFTLGPTSKKPLHIPLTEMSSEEAAAYATSVFLDVWLVANFRVVVIADI